MKTIFILFLFLLINNCSLNKNSKYWTEDVIKRINNQNEFSDILKKSEVLMTLTLKEYEILIDDYTKKSKYPDINQ